MIAESFGQRLRRLREERQLSKSRLARESLVPRSCVAALERGRHLPRLATLMGLADALGVTLDVLAGRG